ncbi:M28 family peptidase, partial [Candidatus Bipolaricaulota bacterium]
MKDQRTSNRLAVALSWIALLLLGVLAVLPLVPPAPPAGPDITAFSTAQALEHIERLAVEPRPIGTPASVRARADIVGQLRLLGLEPELQTIEVPNYFSAAGETIEVVNVMARIPGTTPTTAVALMGHYDTVPTTTGANDDASAVAILLETARAILAGDRLRNDVLVLFMDGEEPAPRFGSTAFITEHPWAGDIGFVINLETIGTGGPSLLIEMNGPGGWVIAQVAKAMPAPVAFSFLTTTTELIGGSNTDFATFRDVGISGVDLAYLHGSPIYHTLADTPERVSVRSLQHQGANALALARHIGNLDFGESRDESHAVFFTVGHFAVVRYPAAWALPIAGLTGGVLVAAGWRQRSWLRSLLGLGTTLATTLVAATAAVGIWTLLGSWRGTMGIAESYA